MTTHIHRPAPWGPIVFGILLLLAIGAPGLVMRPDAQSLAGFLICAGLAAALALLGLARVECTRDGDRLVLHQVRWPFPPRDETFALSDITRIDVRRRRQSRYIVLVLTGDREVYFPGGGSSSPAHDETANVLRGWLGA